MDQRVGKWMKLERLLGLVGYSRTHGPPKWQDSFPPTGWCHPGDHVMCLFECTCLDHLFGVSGRMVCQFGQSSQETHWMVLVYEQVDKNI